MIMLSKAKKEPTKMGKTHRKDPLQTEYDTEEKLMELYDKLASQWARKVEAANKGKANA